MRLNGQWVGWGLLDHSITDFKVRDFKLWARQRFFYAKNLNDTNLFDRELQDVVIEMQKRLVAQGKLSAALYPNAILDEATQLAVGFKVVATPALKPVIFTVEGHLSNMFVGPAAETARILESQGVCQWQPIGYDSAALPFNNASGINELINQINRLIVPTPGRKFGLIIYSQGAIIGCRTYMEHMLPTQGVLHHVLPQLRRVTAFGNPCREKGVIRPAMPNPPAPGERGIADVRMKGTPPFWWEFAHRGDIYAAVPDNDTGEHMTAIYEIVQNNWVRGPNAIVRQILELFLNPGPEIWAVLQAITKGILFAGNMAPHGGFDIGPAIEHMRGVGA